MANSINDLTRRKTTKKSTIKKSTSSNEAKKSIKQQPQPILEPITETNPQETLDGQFHLPEIKRLPLLSKILLACLALLLITIASILMIRLAYANRLYPGSWGQGIYLGGLTKTEAIDLLNRQSQNFSETPISIDAGEKSYSIKPGNINVQYNNQTLVEKLYRQGRSGTVGQQLVDQVGLIIGCGDKNQYDVNYNSGKLAETVVNINNDIVTETKNAYFNYDNNNFIMVDGQQGQRLDFGQFALDFDSHLGLMGNSQLKLPLANISPAIDLSTLKDNQALIQSYANDPITLTYQDKSWQVDADQVIHWLSLASNYSPNVKKTDILNSYYPIKVQSQLKFDSTAIKNYLNSIASQINQSPQNAQLTITDSKASVFTVSHDGKTLDVDKSSQKILDTLNSNNDHKVELAVDIVKPEISEDNIANLGIKELVSEGVTYFPGSPSTRITNVRTGAARFNGVLLKPGETFSFGKILGDVGPEQGYVPELVILGDHEEKQYGGGLCQVSSTAYRAALLAGLPIVERYNHAFAVSYYTAPYGVPGVDATIYYPQVDFKFLNDTGSYILIQTILQGTTLKFDFYGTKTKSGVIRGPQFVSGSNDATQPSHTVFYRDVLDLSGNVTKTDTINTWYKSSKDFPIDKQFN